MAYECRHSKGPYVTLNRNREFVLLEVLRGHPIQGTFLIPFDDQAKRCFSKAGGTKVGEECTSIIRDQNIGLL